MKRYESMSKEELIDFILSNTVPGRFGTPYCIDIPFGSCTAYKCNCRECIRDYLYEDVKEDNNETN